MLSVMGAVEGSECVYEFSEPAFAARGISILLLTDNVCTCRGLPQTV